MTTPLAPHADELLTLREIAAVLKVSYSTVTKWTSRGELAPTRIVRLPNGQLRLARTDLMAWVRGEVI